MSPWLAASYRLGGKHGGQREDSDHRTLKFVEQWIATNVEEDAAPLTSADDPRPADLAARCMADAAAAGVTRAEIAAEYGDLTERMFRTLTPVGPDA